MINSTDKNKDNYMVQSDVAITTSQEIDKERVDYIKKIKLETSFYNVFRNTIRILINDYENFKLREKIEQELSKEYIIYSEKLTNIERLLRQLVKDKIQFTGDKNYYKLINEVSTCIVKDKEKCSASPNLCVVTENGQCNLILPVRNLITNKINDPIYYGRMSDELIRYTRIKSFMFQPQTYLSFNNIGYNLRENEIIMIQSLLTQEYFETLIQTVTNKYIKHNSYDEVNPVITQTYENIIPSLDHAIGRKNIEKEECIKNSKKFITSAAWKHCFPNNYGEIIYNNTNYCTINFIIDLIERKTGKKYTGNKIKSVLFEEYKKYLNKYFHKIVDILILEGKKTLGDQVKGELLTFDDFIYTDNYFLTTFDLWLLVTKYEIPTIFISQQFMLQTKYTKRAFIGYGDNTSNQQFAFIVIPGFAPEKVPVFKLICSNDKDVFISLDKLNEECVERINEAFANKQTIEDYLEQFIKPITRKKKPIPFIIESDSEEKKISSEKTKRNKKTKNNVTAKRK